MSALTLGGTDIPIFPTGHGEEHPERGVLSPSADGYWRSDVTASLGRLKVWSFQTPPLTSTQESSVRTKLETIAPQTAGGYLVDAGSALVRNLREQNNIRLGLVSFSFELHRVSN